ncbi:MAG: WG repeat-containing protein [Microscillaceae bacterium]|jgi:hypothetical protein|nr:WG repeat-containing protein [Microscillaceae bacterium]
MNWQKNTPTQLYSTMLCLVTLLYLSACGSKYDSQAQYIDGIAQVSKSGKFGCIDQSGKEIVPIQYDDITPFVGEVAKIKLNNKYGFVNKEGKEVVAPKYDKVYGFSRGIAKVEIKGKFGFVNEKGKEIIAPMYDAVSYNIIGKRFEVAENGQVRFIMENEVKEL